MTPKEEISKFVNELPTMVSELALPQICLAFDRLLPPDDNDYRKEFFKILDVLTEVSGAFGCTAIASMLDLALCQDSNADMVKFNHEMYERTSNEVFQVLAHQAPLKGRQFADARKKLLRLRSTSLSTEALRKWQLSSL